MTRTLKFMRLDFLGIKPHMKYVYLAAVAYAIMATSTTGIAGAIGMSLMFSAFFVSYPFAIADKANFNALYSQLAIQRREVVRGRYSFLLATSVVVTTTAGLISLVASLVRQTGGQTISDLIAEALPALAATIMLSGFLQALQLPIFFRLPYEKARVAALFILPVFIGAGSMIMMSGGNTFTEQTLVQALQWFQQNAVFAVAGCVIIWLAVMITSFGLSLKFYQQQDF